MILSPYRFVDKAIKATVIGHLFGDESSLLNASIDTTVREDQTEPGKQLLENEVFNLNNGLLITVKRKKKYFADSADHYEPSHLDIHCLLFQLT